MYALMLIFHNFNITSFKMKLTVNVARNTCTFDMFVSPSVCGIDINKHNINMN